MQMDALDAWIGATVKGVAALKGVPLKQVASELDITPSALSNKIHGRNPWTAAQLAATAHLLGVEVGDLYNGYNGSVPFPGSGLASTSGVSQAATATAGRKRDVRPITRE